MFSRSRDQRETLNEIMSRNVFKHVQNMDNLVVYENEEIQIKNLTTKAAV